MGLICALCVGLSTCVVELPKEPTFVEADVEVLFYVDGEGPGQQFGYVAEPIGDVTGDGILDVLTSAPFNSEGAVKGGKLYLLDGATGAQIRTHVGKTAEGFLGFRIAETGDLNGDNVPDYAAGASGNQNALADGEVFVYSGSDGAILHHFEADAKDDKLGFGVHGPGDLNGDGFNDLLVGAPRNDKTDTDAGTVYVYSGADWSLIRTHTGEGRGARLGHACRGVGDLDGDDRPDYVLGAPGAGEDGRGEAYAYSGATGKLLFTMRPQSKSAKEFARYFVNTPGDVNGDGINDIWISDWFDDALGPMTGHIYMFNGTNGELLSQATGDNAGDWFGWGGRGVGDVNGDGIADFTVNDSFCPEVQDAPTAGRVTIRSGFDCSVLRTITSLNGSPSTRQPGEWFGYDNRLIPDINGDGLADLLITAGFNDAKGPQTGRLYVIAGTALQEDK